MADPEPTVAAAGGPAAAAEGQVQTGEAGNGIFGSVTNALSVALRCSTASPPLPHKSE
jgi:hypothetical protein